MKFTVEQMKPFGSFVLTSQRGASVDITQKRFGSFTMNIGTPGPSVIVGLDDLENRVGVLEGDVDVLIDEVTGLQQADVAIEGRLTALETAEPPVSDFSTPFYASAAQQLNANDYAIANVANTVFTMPVAPVAGDKVAVISFDDTATIHAFKVNGQTSVFEIDQANIQCVFRYVDTATGWILC